MNRRIPNGTYGGVRGRGLITRPYSISALTREMLLNERCQPRFGGRAHLSSRSVDYGQGNAGDLKTIRQGWETGGIDHVRHHLVRIHARHLVCQANRPGTVGSRRGDKDLQVQRFRQVAEPFLRGRAEFQGLVGGQIHQVA